MCITELADVCAAYAAGDQSVNVTIEDAGVTLDRLAALGRRRRGSAVADRRALPGDGRCDPRRRSRRAARLHGERPRCFAVRRRPTTRWPSRRAGRGVRRSAAVAVPRNERRRAVVGTRRRVELGYGSPGVRRRQRVGAWLDVVRRQRRRLLQRPRHHSQPLGGRSRLHPVARRPGRHVEWRVALRRQRPGHDGDPTERPRYRSHGRLRTGRSRCRLAALHSQLSCSGDVVAGRAGRARRGCSARRSRRRLTEQLRTSGWDDAATAATPVPSASTMLALRSYWHDAV